MRRYRVYYTGMLLRLFIQIDEPLRVDTQRRIVQLPYMYYVMELFSQRCLRSLEISQCFAWSDQTGFVALYSQDICFLFGADDVEEANEFEQKQE